MDLQVLGTVVIMPLVLDLDFREEISGWSNVYMALLDVFSRHAQNGLLDIKSNAKNMIVDHLDANGIVSGRTINWVALLKHVNKK